MRVRTRPPQEYTTIGVRKSAKELIHKYARDKNMTISNATEMAILLLVCPGMGQPIDVEATVISGDLPDA